MKLWLDDVRPIPSVYDVWAKTDLEAIGFLETGLVTEISFDHDLGNDCGSGYDVAKYIEYQAFLGYSFPIEWHIHSANPVGRKNIEMAMKKAEEFWSR